MGLVVDGCLGLTRPFCLQDCRYHGNRMLNNRETRGALRIQSNHTALKALSIREPCCSALGAAMRGPDGLRRHHSRRGQGSEGVIRKALGRVIKE